MRALSHAHTQLSPPGVQGGNLCQRIYDRCKRRLSYLEILQVLAGGGSRVWWVACGEVLIL